MGICRGSASLNNRAPTKIPLNYLQTKTIKQKNRDEESLVRSLVMSENLQVFPRVEAGPYEVLIKQACDKLIHESMSETVLPQTFRDQLLLRSCEANL